MFLHFFSFTCALGYYCYGEHPVSKVEIVGYIVSIDERKKLVLYGGVYLLHYTNC